MTWLQPDWPAPPQVRAASTSRLGGLSQGPYAGLNLATHVGDDAQSVADNRALLQQALALPGPPLWLEQVHGCEVACLEMPPREFLPIQADASYSNHPGAVCAVMTADCLPLLLCDRTGSEVAAVHAGWRGLCDGVIEAAVARFSAPPAELLAWLGPAIGPQAFEVGAEVREAFVRRDAVAAEAFVPAGLGTRDSGLENAASRTNLTAQAAKPLASLVRGIGGRGVGERGDVPTQAICSSPESRAPSPVNKYFADIFLLARQRLQTLGIDQISGGGLCTYSDPEHFFSYRRDGVCGRMATLIWIEP
ncbi:MAG: laccase domain-containing protein [Gammaproteobacteria bacterium SHHR-1]|nr:laccase domain-containing protein [gamma proteobacterium SS-5]